ncbi:hypothetical protein GW17_00046064 [Ensete ventricosum]|nr:hypothetical protein GW17_00046064 [Ensete ventricosum]
MGGTTVVVDGTTVESHPESRVMAIQPPIGRSNRHLGGMTLTLDDLPVSFSVTPDDSLITPGKLFGKPR